MPIQIRNVFNKISDEELRELQAIHIQERLDIDGVLEQKFREATALEDQGGVLMQNVSDSDARRIMRQDSLWEGALAHCRLFIPHILENEPESIESLKQAWMTQCCEVEAVQFDEDYRLELCQRMPHMFELELYKAKHALRAKRKEESKQRTEKYITRGLSIAGIVVAIVLKVFFK